MLQLLHAVYRAGAIPSVTTAGKLLELVIGLILLVVTWEILCFFLIIILYSTELIPTDLVND